MFNIIDLSARARLAEQQRNKTMMNGMFSAAESAVKLKEENRSLMQEIIKENQQTSILFDKLSRALVMVYKKIPGVTNLPKKFQIFGSVKIDSLPDVKVSNFSEVSTHLKALSLQIQQLKEAISFVGKQTPPAINIPPIAIDGEGVLKQGLKNIENKLDDQAKALLLLAKQKPVKAQDIKIPSVDTSSIVDAINQIPGGTSNADVVDKLADLERVMSAIYDKPTLTPAPVSHISINSLSGSILTTQIQLGSTVTALPAISLKQRRAVQVYNNGANTIYLGGSNVSTANGIPVLAGTFSNIFDAGVNMTIYGISQAGQNNDVRVLEISDQDSGR